MDGTEFKARLRILRRTQVGFATELGVAPRTVHYWAKRGPPPEVAYLLDMLMQLEMPFGPGPAGRGDVMPQSAFHDLVESTIDRLVQGAADMSRTSEFEHAVRSWLEKRHRA